MNGDERGRSEGLLRGIRNSGIASLPVCVYSCFFRAVYKDPSCLNRAEANACKDGWGARGNRFIRHVPS